MNINAIQQMDQNQSSHHIKSVQGEINPYEQIKNILSEKLEKDKQLTESINLISEIVNASSMGSEHINVTDEFILELDHALNQSNQFQQTNNFVILAMNDSNRMVMQELIHTYLSIKNEIAQLLTDSDTMMLRKVISESKEKPIVKIVKKHSGYDPSYEYSSKHDQFGLGTDAHLVGSE